MSLGLNKLEAIELPKPKYLDASSNEQDVDLKVTLSSEHSYEFENTTNLIKTYFKKNISEYAPVKVDIGDHFFEWTPFGVGFADEQGNEDWFGRINDAEAEIDDNKVIYKDLLLGIDDEFIVNAGELKHNTILNSKPVYNHTLPGKQINVVVDGIIDFSTDINMFVDGTIQKDEFETSSEIQFRDSSGDIVFTLPPPVAYEINGSATTQCMYKVIKIGNVISLKIFTPYEWIEDASRAYPVAIDPTLRYISTAGMPTGAIHFSSWSENGDFFALGYNYTTSAYKFDPLTNTVTELNPPQGGYGRTEFVNFAPNGKYILVASHITSGADLRIFSYNTLEQGFTNLISHEPSTGYNIAAFFNKNNRIVYSNNYSIVFQDFDIENGIFLPNKTSSGIPYRVSKIAVSKNDKYLLRIEVLGDKFKINSIVNGSMGPAISLPSGLAASRINDFDLSSDEKFIAFALTAHPYFCVCPFDENAGVIGDPIFPNTPLDMPGVKISFSKKMNYLVVAKNSSSSSERALTIYKFNKESAYIGDQIHIDPNLPQPTTGNGYPITSINFSPTGEHLIVTKHYYTTTPANFFLYKFFYEPENNVFFKDPITEDYYSDNKGNTLMLIDFGTIVAGQTTSPKRILLENCYDYAVKNIQLSISNPSQDFRVELSESDLPFMPQQTLYFNQTLNPRESVPFYIRVTTTDQSQSGGMFEVLAKCDVV
ncbi:hypothetical protein [Paenibacillus lentus]|uniref:WD40 repeat domain-containing protein n=1 Tax=Paenibacillus lentus TaxID=1338368 RepID=A0A3Q8SBW1_9BACL|nr:hypothetical protein [Paenibacillus lentus]AZK47111.1 hypothetical protein EIM92_13880 [Paenibacillus lentus]